MLIHVLCEDLSVRCMRSMVVVVMMTNPVSWPRMTTLVRHQTFYLSLLFHLGKY